MKEWLVKEGLFWAERRVLRGGWEEFEKRERFREANQGEKF